MSLSVYGCPQCPFLSLSFEDIEWHCSATHSNPQPEDESSPDGKLVACPTCPDVSFSARLLAPHLHYHHRMSPSDARLLASRTKPNPTTGRPKSSRSLGDSRRDFPNKCDIPDCGVRLKLVESLNYHKTCHKLGTASLYCPECPDTNSFATLESLHNHLWNADKVDIELNCCDKCSYKTYSRTRLDNIHKKIHESDKKFECDLCDKAFKNKKQLANHKARHRNKETPKLKRICQICKMELSSEAQLTAHTNNVHKQIKLFKCKYCEYSASVNSSLVLHLRSHTGEKPYHCSECDFKTSNKTTLKRHVMRHSKQKQYECDLCDYSCIQASSIKTHMKLKHPGCETSLFNACPNCPYVSVSKKNFAIHLLSHSSSKPPDETPKISVKSNLLLKGPDASFFPDSFDGSSYLINNTIRDDSAFRFSETCVEDFNLPVYELHEQNDKIIIIDDASCDIKTYSYM